jgi:hypothetical protein
MFSLHFEDLPPARGSRFAFKSLQRLVLPRAANLVSPAWIARTLISRQSWLVRYHSALHKSWLRKSTWNPKPDWDQARDRLTLLEKDRISSRLEGTLDRLSSIHDAISHLARANCRLADHEKWREESDSKRKSFVRFAQSRPTSTVSRSKCFCAFQSIDEWLRRFFVLHRRQRERKNFEAYFSCSTSRSILCWRRPQRTEKGTATRNRTKKNPISAQTLL